MQLVMQTLQPEAVPKAPEAVPKAAGFRDVVRTAFWHKCSSSGTSSHHGADSLGVRGRRSSVMLAVYRSRSNIVIRPYGRLAVMWECVGALLLLSYAASSMLWFGEVQAMKVNWRACVAGAPAFSTPARLGATRPAEQVIQQVSEPSLLRQSPSPTFASLRGSGCPAASASTLCLGAPMGVLSAMTVHDAMGDLDLPPKVSRSSPLLDELHLEWRKLRQRWRLQACHPLDPRPTRTRPPPCLRMCQLSDAIKVAIDAFELLSFLLLLRTAFKRPDGTYELRPRGILRHRLSCRRLPLALIAALPLYTLAVHCTSPTQGSPLHTFLQQLFLPALLARLREYLSQRGMRWLVANHAGLLRTFRILMRILKVMCACMYHACLLHTRCVLMRVLKTRGPLAHARTSCMYVHVCAHMRAYTHVRACIHACLRACVHAHSQGGVARLS